MRVRWQGQKTRRSRTMLLASLVRRRHALCDLHKCTCSFRMVSCACDGRFGCARGRWTAPCVTPRSWGAAAVAGANRSHARASMHDAEMTCVSEGTLESGGRRAQDREVFLSMDACIRGVPCVRGGLVDPISAGPLTPCKTLDGRRGLLRSREGGKTKRDAEPAALGSRPDKWG